MKQQQQGPSTGHRGQPVNSRLVYLPRITLSRVCVFLGPKDIQNIATAHPLLMPQRPANSRQQQHPSQRGGRGRGRAGRGRRGRGRAGVPVHPLLLGAQDPHTLLARLNTRRLYKRLKYLKKKPDTGDEIVDPYRYHLTTEQIAVAEWHDLLKNASKKKQEESSSTRKITIPSPCELLLFSPCPRPVALLASYPRSGNSLLRNLFERTTLRVTGSDMRGGLTKHDLVGEAAVSEGMVQFVKTHFPERKGHPVYPASRAVLLVRNPYDAIESHFNLMMTGTHTSTITDEVRGKYDELWERMVMKEIAVWRAFHEYWLQQNIPLLVIRYEDLIRNTDLVLEKVIKFVLEINNMGFFRDRINQCTREDIERLGSYKPRSGGVGKSLKRYSPELLQKMNVGIYSTMEKFGYDEMLVPDPKSWKLEPLDEYGVVIDAGLGGKPLAVNAGAIVRDKTTFTDWAAVRRELGIGQDVKCNCPKCSAVR